MINTAISFLFGLNRSDEINQLLAGACGDIQRFNSVSNTWVGMNQPISATMRGRMRTFLDKGFWVNGVDRNKRYDGVTWTDEVATKHAPIARYIHIDPNQSRMYLAYLTFVNQVYASKVWYTDFAKNNDITYGLEYGTDLRQTANSPTVMSSSAYFKLRNIKVGDPFFIISGANAGEYLVSSIDTETQITLTENLKSSATNSTYWVGGNWFDVETNNNDVLTGIGDNSSQVLFFKNESLSRFAGNTLSKVKGVPGTHAQSSVVNIKEYTYYFHRTGVWRYNGVTSELISRPIQDYIDGIDTDNYTEVVAWKVGETYRIFVGDVSNSETSISVSKCILDFDTITESWSPGKFPVTVTAATTFVESNAENVYIGTDDCEVYQDNTGTSDNGVAIPWMMDTGWHFPVGPEVEIRLSRIQIHNKAGRGIPIKYMLYGTPFDIDKQWRGLDDLEDEVTEIWFSPSRDVDTIARGCRFMLQDSSAISPPTIERIDVFYKLVTARSL